jgi:4-hydroxy-tetrahydrodipicolinate synthase
MAENDKLVRGVYAALLTPRTPAGAVDKSALLRTVEFLAAKGVRRAVVNGATGEYCRTTRTEFATLLETLAARPDIEFLCGVGAADFSTSAAMAREAFRAGARAVLLPSPHFFPYSQDDLLCYFRTVAETAGGPVLLYNLPRFTTPIEPETAMAAIAGTPRISGIKDSSGSLDILRRLTAEGPRDACRIVGDDSALTAALREGVCDGVVSGVAGVLPELITYLFEHSKQMDTPQYREREQQLEDYIGWLSRFPVPWGLKWTAEWRGLAPACFALPMSAQRRECAQAFGEWFHGWWRE